MAELPSAPFLYPITDRSIAGQLPIEAIIDALCTAGARLIQVREKQLTTSEFTRLVRQAIQAAQGRAAIIVNDRCDVALYTGASGVHLGDDELRPADARAVLGSNAIIGVSCHSLADVRRADRQPVSYIAVGPVFGTASKQIRYADTGLDLVKKARHATTKPIVAIGGINASSIGSVISAGADGCALIGAVMAEGKISEQYARLARAAGIT